MSLGIPYIPNYYVGIIVYSLIANLPRLVNFGFGSFSEGTDCSQYGEKNAVMKMIKVTLVSTTANLRVREASYHSLTIVQQCKVCLSK